MAKNYQDFTKEEKKQAKERYYATEFGKITKGRFIRLLITGTLCIIWSIGLIIENIINENSIWQYIIAATLLISGIVFLIGRYKIFIRNMNNYLNKKKK